MFKLLFQDGSWLCVDLRLNSRTGPRFTGDNYMAMYKELSSFMTVQIIHGVESFMKNREQDIQASQ